MAALTNLALNSLAAYRLARLVSVDDITEPLRTKVTDWLVGNGGTYHRKLAELIGCPHCSGVWISFGVIAVAPYVVPGWKQIIRPALAVAAIESILADLSAAAEAHASSVG
jgi:hypothetical protein